MSKAWVFVTAKHEIFSAADFDSKNCVFNHQSRVTKPDLRRICLHMIPDWRNARTYTFLVAEDVIVNLSLVLKRLKDGLHLGHG